MAKKTKQEKITKKAVEEDEDELEDDDDDAEVELEEDDDVEEDAEEGDDDEEEAPAPKKKAAKGEKKTGKGSGLVPREPVSIPKAVLKAQSPEVQALLKTRDSQQAAGDKKGLRKTRAALRKAGFRLSNVSAASEE